MSESQFYEAAAYDEFLSWKDNAQTWRQGSGGPPNANPEHGDTPDASYRYIPMSVLKKEFSKPRLQHLLDAVFARSENAAPDAETILKHYLRPFLILVLIERGSQILRFVRHNSLKDDCLPFRTLPYGLHESTNWFSTFCDEQWQFCPVQFSYNMDRDLSSKDVLPLRYVRQLGSGGSAFTYEVQIDTEYNDLRHPDHGELDTLERNKDIYVMKSYQTSEAQECYETECDGFRKLRRDSKPPANIIAFYGNFKWGTSRNLLLEYADRGTLKDYMTDEEPPVRGEQIEQFWYNVLGLFDGLVTIHGKPGMPPGKHKFMIGWHQDLSPSNILVQSGKSGTPYDCRFKIADLEHSHFQKSKGVRDVTTKDSQGTFAYGPPESCKTDPDIQRWDLQVDQKVDVWGIGCILSELAVWVGFGLNKVTQYQQERGAEFKRKTGKQGQCFHDEKDILEAVREIHLEVISSRRIIDEWTPQVIESIQDDMMLPDPRSRLSAIRLYHGCKRIVNESLLVDVGIPLVGSSSRHSGLASLPNLRISTHGPNVQPNPPFYLQDGRLGMPEPHPRTQFGIKQNAEYYHVESFDANTILGSDNQRTYGNVEMPETRKSPRISPSKVSRGESEVTERGHERSPVNGVALSPHQNPNSALGREHNFLALNRALELKRQKEQGDRSHLAESYAHIQLVRSLKGRDHVFVVDLAASMEEHRPLMTQWLEALGYMVQSADPDGMDVYFTNGTLRGLKAKSWKDLVSHFNRQSFEDTTYRPGTPHLLGVPHLIKQILEDYQNQLHETHRLKYYFGIGKMPKKGPRKLCMYVLTNGDWGRQEDLKRQISALVTALCENNMINKQVAIQFLRFGDIGDGIKNLHELDCELGLQLDINDTEPAQGGDVHKVIFGAVDENYDDDPSP